MLSQRPGKRRRKRSMKTLIPLRTRRRWGQGWEVGYSYGDFWPSNLWRYSTLYQEQLDQVDQWCIFYVFLMKISPGNNGFDMLLPSILLLFPAELSWNQSWGWRCPLTCWGEKMDLFQDGGMPDPRYSQSNPSFWGTWSLTSGFWGTLFSDISISIHSIKTSFKKDQEQLKLLHALCDAS